jgi:hypothetical protein
MPTGAHNKQSQLYSMRIPLDLAERINAYAEVHELPRNQTLIELLTRGLSSDTPSNTPENTPSDTTLLIADLAARIEALEARFQSTQNPQGDMVTNGNLDEAKSYLGPLCKRSHDWQGTGQSRRSRRNGACMTCEAQAAREKRMRDAVRA